MPKCKCWSRCIFICSVETARLVHRIHRKAANVSGSSKAKVESGLKHKAKMCTVHRYMGFRKSNPVKLKLYPHKDICGRYEKPAKCAETKTQVHNAHLPRFIFHQLVELGFSFGSHWSRYLHTASKHRIEQFQGKVQVLHKKFLLEIDTMRRVQNAKL